MQYFMRALQKYVDFDGRDTRRQYWMFFLFWFVFGLLVALLGKMLDAKFLSEIYSIVLLLPSLAIGARRLHDTGRSGWWQLIGLIPIIGPIVLIVFFVQDSHPENEYGPNPKLSGADA